MGQADNSERTVKQLRSVARRLRKKLTDNQAIFCQLYLESRNATQSYLQAYSKSCNSETVAAVNGSRMLRNAKIKPYIDAELDIIRQRHLITPDNLLREESNICYSDLGALFNGETLISPDQLPADVRKALSSVKVKTMRYKVNDSWETETTYEYKFWDKGAALGRMERHLGMYVDKQELTGPGGAPLEYRDMSKNEIARRVAFMLYNEMKNSEGD